MKFRETFLSNRPKKFRDILIVLAAFFVALVSFIVLMSDLNPTDTNIQFHQRLETLNKDWHVTTETTDMTTDLPVWIDANPGERIRLSKTIPDMDSPHYTVVARNYHQKLFVFVDDDLIYNFPKNSQEISSAIITDDWNMIYLNQSSSNHTLTLEYEVGIAPFHGYIGNIYFGEDNALTSYLQSEYRLPYILAVALIMIGLLLIIIATVYTKSFSDKYSFILGFVFVSAGIWFADRSKMPIFMVGSNIKFFVAFTVLSMVPLLISLYGGERFKDHKQTIPNTLAYGSIIFVFILFLLVALKKYPIHGVIPYLYLAILICCVYLVYLLWYYSYGKGRIRLNRVQLNATKMEFIAAIATIAGSMLSILWDAISSNNWSSSHREWSGVGNIQMFSVIVFAFAQLIILLYTSYYGVLESESIQKQLHDSRLQLMMGQIQPHFMFNTLSSIRTLIKLDPDVAYDMTYNFSNYLRANVDNLTNLDGILFSAEVEHIKSYVSIEMIRFGDRLKVEFDINEDHFVVPPLSIQPLVENAIKHGVCKRPEGGTVWLRSYKDGENYIVVVEDNGVGITPERLNEVLYGNNATEEESLVFTGNGSENHQSTGMRNIVLRLKEISGASLDISSEPEKGTIMKVTFPQEGQPNNVDSLS